MKQLQVYLVLAVVAVMLLPVMGATQPKRQAPRACPPFYLRDTMGNIINPHEWDQELQEWKDMMSSFGDGVSIDPSLYGMTIPPYSPKKTCGECHRYNKITAGYHFRMGSDVLHDEYGVEQGEPQSLSDGTVGKFSRMYFLQFPPKSFDSPAEVDVGLYQWTARCGTCHPGGGPLEYDRERHRLDDRDPKGLSSFDGDYFQAHWDLSGALEADCLFCHLNTYSYQERYEQVQGLNYRWAPTVGAELGSVNGTVAAHLGSLADPDLEEALPMPTVEYDKSKFLPDGRVHLDIQRPNDENCLFCHDLSFVEKHGTTFGDVFAEDVHSHRGVMCTDCHVGGLHHNFDKGDSHELTVRDDLDGTALTCEECHTEGSLGAPKMVHKGLPPIHMEKIGCEVCHVPTLRVAAIGLVDVSLGKPSTRASQAPSWFGYREEERTLHPLWYSQIRHVLERILRKASPAEREALADEDGDGMPDFDTEDEIKNALKEMYKEEQFEGRQLVYVRKGQVKTFAQAFEAFLVYELLPDRERITYEVFKEQPTYRPKYGDVWEWRPTYGLDEEGKIRAYNNQTCIWWGHKDGERIVPLFLREVSSAVDQAAAQIWYEDQLVEIDGLIKEEEQKLERGGMSALETRDSRQQIALLQQRKQELSPEDISAAELPDSRDKLFDGRKAGEELAKDHDGDGKREVNTETEIANFSKLLKQRLSGVRFEELNPVLVSGTKVHEAAEDGSVTSSEHSQAEPVLWSVSHNVAPRKDSLGADGNCEECHSPGAYFFYGKAVLEPYDKTEDAKPVMASMIDMMGYPDARPDEEPVVVQTSQFFKWLTITVMALLILHILADLIRRAVRKKAE